MALRLDEARVPASQTWRAGALGAVQGVVEPALRLDEVGAPASPHEAGALPVWAAYAVAEPALPPSLAVELQVWALADEVSGWPRATGWMSLAWRVERTGVWSAWAGRRLPKWLKVPAPMALRLPMQDVPPLRGALGARSAE